jgi:hypothetical protein
MADCDAETPVFPSFAIQKLDGDLGGTAMATTLLKRGGMLAFAAVVALAALAVPAAAASEPTNQPPGLDHLYCYPVAPTTQATFTPPAQVQLKDQFGTSIVDVGAVQRLCAPATKTRLDTGQSFPPQNPDAHLACFGITDPNFSPTKLKATNQFGDAMLDVLAAQSLCLPSWKSLSTPPTFPAATAPSGLDHFKCYTVRYTVDSSGNPTNVFGQEPANVQVVDQFGPKIPVLGRPVLLCNPAEKTRLDLPGQPVTPITNPDAKLVCFEARDDQQYPQQPWLKNQFGIALVKGATISPSGAPLLVGNMLCLPSFTAPK